ncbi:tRNA (adenosine(37)-N6)-dimethylallyltransferase MiaA [Prevotella pallens]|uniref:tRNA (adenosine(37)-N6)-dimethylallyltransferase MiaA n=1 Tax=Prevotella pallens TaxID=60133 RepID=UPI001CB0C674|nr:tRNA (adenosine(37)-N6)-dimethylallyltransferase MiaA [Prevotella pallens]MBF1462426.1 tRNA (adenosine(37)-N6)-dimethylallyltransferase MiaA [Prevotella pallens]
MKIQSLIVVTGPTGVGKTALTLDIAQHYGIEIINADSRQIYKELQIGTAAPTKAQLERVKHHFVASKNVNDYYSASLYEQDVLELLKANPSSTYILSGGSMMYVDAVCYGIDEIPTIDNKVRQDLMKMYEAEGLNKLCDLLKDLDPAHWDIVDKQNPRRVLHALEVCVQTGKTYTSFRTKQRKERPFNIIKIGLNCPREDLYNQINARVENMVASGLIDEVLRMYNHRNLNALNTVGYKEMFEYLDGLTTLDEAIFKIQSNTRQYARKQLTWFRKDKDIHWFHPNEIRKIIRHIDSYLA